MLSLSSMLTICHLEQHKYLCWNYKYLQIIIHCYSVSMYLNTYDLGWGEQKSKVTFFQFQLQMLYPYSFWNNFWFSQADYNSCCYLTLQSGWHNHHIMKKFSLRGSWHKYVVRGKSACGAGVMQTCNQKTRHKCTNL